MKTAFLLFMIVVTYLAGSAQDSVTVLRGYKADVFYGKKFIRSGIIHEVSDSTFTLKPKYSFLHRRETRRLVTFNYDKVNKISLRKKGDVLLPAAGGAVLGYVIGLIIGHLSGDDTPCGTYEWFCTSFTAKEKARLNSLYGGFAGVSLGFILGSTLKRKFNIDGKKENFRQMQLNLMRK
jgi:hypothetical protein